MTQLRFRSAADEAGFTILPNPVLLSRKIRGTAKLLYALLRYYARQQGACWPGQDRLAAHLQITDRQVRSLIGELAMQGLITVEQRGQQRTNRYWIEPITDELCQHLTPDRNSTSGQDRNSTSGPMEEDSG